MGWHKLLVPRSVRARHEPSPAPAVSKPNRRQNHRVNAFLPVFIYGHSHDQPFVENAVTINVSANGGLLPLSREVVASQKFLVANMRTNEELPCRIAHVIKTQAGTTLVGFEFLRPSPRFWSIEFRSQSRARQQSQYSIAQYGFSPAFVFVLIETTARSKEPILRFQSDRSFAAVRKYEQFERSTRVSGSRVFRWISETSNNP